MSDYQKMFEVLKDKKTELDLRPSEANGFIRYIQRHRKTQEVRIRLHGGWTEFSFRNRPIIRV